MRGLYPPVEVKNAVEACRISVEVNLVVGQRISVTQSQQSLVSLCSGQLAQPSQRFPLQGLPEDLVAVAANIEAHLGVVSPVLHDVGGVGVVVSVEVRLLAVVPHTPSLATLAH